MDALPVPAAEVDPIPVDPADDLAASRDDGLKMVKEFVGSLAEAIRSQDVPTINNLYEVRFNMITDRYFKTEKWPGFDLISPLVGNDDLLLTLYKELFYRHIYAKLTPAPSDRRESFENYLHLFSFILSDAPLPLVLPHQWIWDMLDEFVYQFQTFHQYRPRLKQRSTEEIAFLKANPQLWDLQVVNKVLLDMIEKSNIVALLQRGEDCLVAPVGKSGDASHLRRLCGYFAIVEIVRLYCLLGDYSTALSTLSQINLAHKGLYTRVPACYCSVCYYLGFSYMMLRRYLDAIRAFQGILRTRLYHTRSYQYESIVKKTEQMYVLLALCVALYPQRVDESVLSSLREKLGDKLSRLQRGDESAFEELFSFACPKFINPVLPNFEDPAFNATLDAHKMQARLFMREIKEQLVLGVVRSYLKLYTTLPVAKLARFMELDADRCRELLLCLKHKSQMLVNDPAQGASLLAGTPTNLGDVDFYLDAQDLIHISERKRTKATHEYFMHNMVKLDSIAAQIERISCPERPAAAAAAPAPLA